MSDVNMYDLWKTIKSLNADQLTAVDAYIRVAKMHQYQNGANPHVASQNKSEASLPPQTTTLSQQTDEEIEASIARMEEGIRLINEGMTEEQWRLFDEAIHYKEPFDEEEFEELFGWIDDLPEDQR